MAREYSPIDLQALSGAVSVISESQEIFVDPIAGREDGSDGTFGNPYERIEQALDFLRNKHLLSNVSVTIRLRKGVHVLSDTLVFKHPQGNQISIIGDTPFTTNRVIGNRSSKTDLQQLYRYIDTSAYTPNTPLLNTVFDPATKGCASAGSFPAFPQITNPVDGVETTLDDGSRFAMICRPFLHSTGNPIQETVTLRSGPLSPSNVFGPNDYVVVHPWFDTGASVPYTVSGSIRADVCQQNLGGFDNFNRHGPNHIQPVNGTSEPEYPTDMKGRYDDREGTLRRFYAVGVHRLIGISAGVAGADNEKDFILENLNTNRNQFRNLPESGGVGPQTGRIHTLSDPADADGAAYAQLDGDLKFDYVIPQTYIYFTGGGDGILVEGNRALRMIENVCIIGVDRLSSSNPNSGGAIVAENGSTINVGKNVYVSNFAHGIEARGSSSISYLWNKNSQAPVITKCNVGVLAQESSSITLPAVCCTACNFGVIAERGSQIHLQDSLIVASTNDAYVANDNSYIKSYYSMALYSGQKQAGQAELDANGIQGGGAGFAAVNNSSILCYGSMSFRSSGAGFLADKSSNIDCSFSDAIDNLGGGVNALNGSNATCESTFVKQSGVVGFYAYNNSSIGADFACSMFTGVDGPKASDGFEFGDGVNLSKNSSMDFDGLTSDKSIDSNMVLDMNSSAVSRFGACLFHDDPPQDGNYSVLASNGSKVVIDELPDPEVQEGGAGREFTYSVRYGSSVNYNLNSSNNHISAAHDVPNVEGSETGS